MTKHCPLYWGAKDQGGRMIGMADYEVADDGTEILLSWSVDDPEIRSLLFPAGQDHEFSLGAECQPAP